MSRPLPKSGQRLFRGRRRPSRRLIGLAVQSQAPLSVDHPVPPGDAPVDAPKMARAGGGGHSEGLAGGSVRGGGEVDPRMKSGGDKGGEAGALRAEIAELEAAQGAATGWGAAVGAREERLRHLRGMLDELEGAGD